jgi:hypothetical protein
VAGARRGLDRAGRRPGAPTCTSRSTPPGAPATGAATSTPSTATGPSCARAP